MKVKYFLFIVISLSTFCFFGCNNDFLDENNKQVNSYLLNDTIYIDNTQLTDNPQIDLLAPDANNRHYKIVQFPQWMNLNSLEGNFKDGMSNIHFQLGSNYRYENSYGQKIEGLLVLSVDGLGYLGITIVYENVGSPQFRVEPTELSFGKNSSTAVLLIHNDGAGKLKWKITEAPSWIRDDSSMKGQVSAHEHQYVSLACNRNELAPGEYSGTITLENNSINNKKQTIPVRLTIVEPNPALSIAGTVTGSCFDKNQDILYVITKSPSRLLIYDTKQKPGDLVLSSEISLQRAPNCISLSENGNLILLGQSGSLSCYDVSSRSITKTIELDFNPFSIVYGENNRCYMTPDADYAWEALICVNLTNDEVTKTHTSDIGARTYLSKIKNSQTLIGSRKDVSPTGVILVDVSNGIPDSENYWHSDFGRFWISEDGKYLYGSHNAVLRTPNMASGGDLLPLAYLNDSRHTAGWMDHCAQTQTLWTVELPDGWGYSRNVFGYNGNDYELSTSFLPSDYQTTINGKQDFYETCVHYVFSNKSGNFIYLVKNLRNITHSGERTNHNAWSLEVVKI